MDPGVLARRRSGSELGAPSRSVAMVTAAGFPAEALLEEADWLGGPTACHIASTHFIRRGIRVLRSVLSRVLPAAGALEQAGVL